MGSFPNLRQSAPRACGGCGACCRILDLPEIAKPAGQMCQHYDTGVGCAIHPTRPGACRTFNCFWIMNDTLGEDWRPDRCGFTLWSQTEGVMIVDVDPARPDAWRQEPYYSRLIALAAPVKPGGLRIFVRIWPQMLMLFPEGPVDLGEQQPGKNIDFGYQGMKGLQAPYARYVDKPVTH